jgi:hypothetical protein
MRELALYCSRSGDAVDLIAVYGQYTSPAGPPHILAYLGGSPDGARWRAERILVERTADESVALVTEMGEWNAGSTFVRRPESSEYRPAQRALASPVDSDFDDRIYALVNQWVYWDENVLRLKMDEVGPTFSDRVAHVGPVDRETIVELRTIWLTSMPDPS